MNYLKAALDKDEQLKINELTKLIELGTKLKKDVTPDKKKLEILLERNNKKSTQVSTSNINSDSDLFHSIKSVYTSQNSIIIDFNVPISRNDIKFFQLKQDSLFRDIFDIKGFFKDALSTKLELDGIDKITLGQFKPDVLRVVLSNKKNVATSFTLNDKQLIIKINNIKEITKENTSSAIENKVIEQENTLLDSENFIQSITSNEDKVIVRFNKDYSKNNIKFVNFKNAENYENIFDLVGNFKYISQTKLEVEGIDKIVVSQKDSNGIKIRYVSKNNMKFSYTLSKRELIISTTPINKPKSVQDIKPKEKEKIEKPKIQEKTTPIPVVAKRTINKTIVIDAGHGGDDSGAVGPNKRYEKVVNLNTTKYLASILQQRGYKVYLTRNNDTFIKVMDRTILANDKNADLFISVHTNAVPKEKANEVDGIETFFLSPARSERAKRVAALENKSDIREMSDSSKDVFLESLNRPRITASHKFAIDVQAGLLQAGRSKYKDIKDSGVREGPFWVLVGAQMPSILIELGYISHPTESKRLYDKDYQQALANGIANGVDSYFSKNP